MGSLFSTLEIARSGLQTSQVQMEVSSHNIANVNREGYSRQRATIGTIAPNLRTYGSIGRGVYVQDVERIRESFLDTVYRQQVPGQGYAEIRAAYFTRVEDLFQEPGEQGFASNFNSFFDALNDFSNNVEEQPVRMAAITEAQSLATSLNQMAQGLYALRTNANEEVRNMVPQINDLAERIAKLNKSITDSEITGNKANDLRDERDNLLDELATLVNINFRERVNGQIDVMVNGETLINGVDFRALEAVRDDTIDPERGDLVAVRFADNGQPVGVTDGALFGALTVRDDMLVSVKNRFDEITTTLIQAVNSIQANGNGTQNLSSTTGSNAVDDTAAALSAAGLPFATTPGTFNVVVYDATGNPTTSTITVTAATTLESLAADLAAVAGINASVTTDNRLSIEAEGANTFSFSGDTSNTLVALGINGLFTGSDAASIGVNQAIIDDPRLLTSSYSTDVTETGSNDAALDLASIRNQLLLEGNSATINDYYETTIVEVGVDANANISALDMQNAFIEDFQRRRDEVSGVSIDEEVTNMMQYQRAYQASARVISIVDRMLDALFNAVG